MRLFFALDPTAELKRQIDGWRDVSFRELAISGRARPVPPDNFHLTLAFIGEVAQRDLESLCEQADAIVGHETAGSGQLNLRQIGYWPRPGILWLGPETCPRELAALAGKLRQLAARFGGRSGGKPFTPHVTLFRRCELPPPSAIQEPDFLLEYREIVLMESRQTKRGVIYYPLACWQI